MRNQKFEIGQCVRIRRRHWLIENIESSEFAPDALEVRCLDDDATGQKQLVIPSCEIAIECVDDQLWHQLGSNVSFIAHRGQGGADLAGFHTNDVKA